MISAAKGRSPHGSPAQRVPCGEEAQGNGMRNARQGIPNEMDFAPTRGRTGFDGDAEAGIAGGGAWPP